MRFRWPSSTIPLSSWCRTPPFSELQAALKSKAIGARDGLALLEHERWCAPGFVRESEQCQVDAGLLVEAKAARSYLADMLQKEHGCCLEDLRRCLQKNSSMLQALDRSFKLECEYVFQKGDSLVSEAVERQIISALPTAIVKMSLAQSIGVLESLHEDRLHQYAPREAQNRMEAVLEVIRNMAKGISPSSQPEDGSVFWARIWASLPLYLRRPGVNSGESAGSAAPPELLGRKALAAELQSLTERFAAMKVDVKLQDLEKLQPLKWLMAPDERKQFALWVEQTLKDITDSAGAVTRFGQGWQGQREASWSQQEQRRQQQQQRQQQGCSTCDALPQMMGPQRPSKAPRDCRGVFSLAVAVSLRPINKNPKRLLPRCRVS